MRPLKEHCYSESCQLLMSEVHSFSKRFTAVRTLVPLSSRIQYRLSTKTEPRSRSTEVSVAMALPSGPQPRIIDKLVFSS